MAAGADLDPDLAVNARLGLERRDLRRLALGGGVGEHPLDLFVGQALHPGLGGKGPDRAEIQLMRRLRREGLRARGAS